jgi:hypothetical protein
MRNEQSQIPVSMEAQRAVISPTFINATPPAAQQRSRNTIPP